MDNIGNYISYEELISGMFLSGNKKVTSNTITLSNKVVDVDGDEFEYTLNTTVQVGSVILQNGYTALVKEMLTAPNRIKITTTGLDTKITNGPAKELYADSLPQGYAEEKIKDAMALVDMYTGQFFHKREGIFKIPGTNTPLLLLGVPIIAIEELLINSTDIELFEGEDNDFVAFKGRSAPQDDRLNPKIKLNVGSGRDNIFTNSMTSRIFVKNTLTQITGAFGYLEADGSTPRAIKQATTLLVMDEINKPVVDESTVGSGVVGPLKRLKVDLHEEEYFESQSNKQDGLSSTTGNPAVDRILAKYKRPILIGGSIIQRSSDRLYEKTSI